MMMNQTEEQSKQKFISLMRNLIQHINQNPTVQLTIYQCLNTQQIKRLFESLHDHSKILRSTALVFVCKLLYNSPQIIDTLLLRDNCDVMYKKNGLVGSSCASLQKYIITGLKNYKMEVHVMADIINTINNKIKYRKNVLFWYIELSTKNIGYFSTQAQLEDTAIDPQTHIIGIFLTQSETTKQGRKTAPNPPTPLARKTIQEQNKTKYTISKQGYFSSANRKF